MLTDKDSIAWWLASLIALVTGRDVLDELALQLAATAQLDSA